MRKHHLVWINSVSIRLNSQKTICQPPPIPDLYDAESHHPTSQPFWSHSNQHEARFIIETHSENFLLRIRRRIAEKSFDSNQVIIYWINDDPNLGERIQTIQIHENGDVDKWPQGVFSEDFEEVKAIRKAQKEFWQ
jgi:predicted ATPase